MNFHWALACGLVLAASARASDIQWPYGDDPPIVTSDYGPRVKPKNGSPFHKGIDMQPHSKPLAPYRYMGYPIGAISSGTIVGISQDGGKIWSLQIQSEIGGKQRTISYLHIFDRRTLSPAGLPRRVFESWDRQFELGVSSVTGHYYIIRKDASPAAFSQDRPFDVLGPNGLIRTKQTVSLGEIIAPTGNSGPVGIKPHLHLDFLDSAGIIPRNIFALLPHTAMHVIGEDELRSNDIATWNITNLYGICGATLTDSSASRVYDATTHSTSTVIRVPLSVKIGRLCT